MGLTMNMIRNFLGYKMTSLLLLTLAHTALGAQDTGLANLSRKILIKKLENQGRKDGVIPCFNASKKDARCMGNGTIPFTGCVIDPHRICDACNNHKEDMKSLDNLDLLLGMSATITKEKQEKKRKEEEA